MVEVSDEVTATALGLRSDECGLDEVGKDALGLLTGKGLMKHTAAAACIFGGGFASSGEYEMGGVCYL